MSKNEFKRTHTENKKSLVSTTTTLTKKMSVESYKETHSDDATHSDHADQSTLVLSSSVIQLNGTSATLHDHDNVYNMLSATTDQRDLSFDTTKADTDRLHVTDQESQHTDHNTELVSIIGTAPDAALVTML